MDLLINELTNKFVEKIPKDDPDKEELIKNFRNYIENTIEVIKNSSSKFISQDEEMIIKTIQVEADMIINSDLITIKQKLLRDNNLFKVQAISRNAFQLACDKVDGKGIDNKINIDSIIESLEKFKEQIKPCNQSLANSLISEAILDLNLLNRTDFKITSLRINRYLNLKNRYDGNEEET